MTATPAFRCKHFTVQHDRCAMKVNTDALLLGAWAALPSQGAMLDIGTGSGIISLMVAQRTAKNAVTDAAVHITAIELDPEAAQQAAENAAQSPWAGRLTVLHGDVLDWQPPHPFALIISNPPFFSDSLGAAQPQRHQARHTDSLPLPDLLARSKSWLLPHGALSVILPADVAAPWVALAEQAGWYLQRCCQVRPSPNHAIHRWLVTLDLTPNALGTVEQLTIKDESNDYSPAYRALLRDFYLRF